MASVLLGVAGSALGGMIGGPVGASIGYAVGSMLGNLLDPPKVEGPRLKDLNLQDSSYGAAIPILYGTLRLPGNVIWQTDLQEHEEKSGGKGGPEITNYTYSASFASLICAGPILGISKIWADGRVVWDTTSGTNSSFPFTLYLGDETQLPDPTMEAELGVGNVPAHRGYAYVVFDELPLADFGNRIPSLEFEAFTEAGSFPWRVSTFSPWSTQARYQYGGATYADGVVTVSTVDLTPGNAPVDYVLAQYDINGNGVGSTITQTLQVAALGVVRNLNIVAGYYNDMSGTVTNWYEPNIPIGSVNVGFDISSTAFTSPSGLIGNMNVYMNDFVYTVGGNSGANPIGRYRAPLGVGGAWEDYTTLDIHYDASDIALGTSDTGHLYVMTGVENNCKLWKFSADLATTEHFWAVADTNATKLAAHGNFHVYKDYICFNRQVAFGISEVALVKIGAGFSLTDHPITLPHNDGWVGNLTGGLMIDENGIFSLDPPPGPVLLSDIVADLSDRSGFDPSEYDVSQLTDEVDGFKVAEQMTTRNAIEPLRAAYHFDGVEVDLGVDFVKRGGASLVTIDTDDLAAREYGGSGPATLETVRTPEGELPREVSVDFIDADTDYQIGTQLAERQIINSDAVTTLTLPINLDQGEARQIANVRLFEEWNQRERFKFVTSRKYAKYVPTDVVTIGARVLRLVDKQETPRGVITFAGVLSNSDIYIQPALGVPSTGFTPTTPPGPTVSTTAELFDIPMVQDSDLDHGFYVAMGPATTVGSWSGASLYRSVDGGTTYTSVASVNVASIMGRATTQLPDFGGGNVFDENSTVTVLLTSGTLTSATEDAVLNGENMAILGLEIFQFKNATLVGTDTYELSGLLRGRRGTEDAIPAHSIGERFAMLPLTNVDTPVGNLFQTHIYKAVTFGQTLASATPIYFANMGMATRPYSPVQVGGGINASGDLTINWKRRTRIGGAWLDFVDVPLGEASEDYVVQIWDSTYTDCARIITATTQTATYAAAQQVTDFGATQQTIYATVGQLGAYMLGVQTRAVLAGAGASVGSVLVPITPYNGSPTPPPGGSGGTVNATLTYPSDQQTTSGYLVGDTYTLSFTSSGSPAAIRVSVAEYQDPPTFRHVILSSDVNGNTVLAEGWGVGLSLFYTPAASTTYYIIIRVELPWGGTGRPLGEGADMVISLQLS